jgi:hypothetical protein
MLNINNEYFPTKQAPILKIRLIFIQQHAYIHSAIRIYLHQKSLFYTQKRNLQKYEFSHLVGKFKSNSKQKVIYKSMLFKTIQKLH